MSKVDTNHIGGEIEIKSKSHRFDPLLEREKSKMTSFIRETASDQKSDSNYDSPNNKKDQKHENSIESIHFGNDQEREQ